MSRNRSNNNDERRRRKKIHDSEYIAYCERGESAAVHIMRNIQTKVDVKKMWIDVISIKNLDNDSFDSEWHEFDWFVVELFPKKIYPEYSDYMSDEEKQYVTWCTATDDIFRQREKGFKGKKYIVYPRIKVKNVSETRTRTVDFTLEMYDPFKEEWIDCGHGPVPKGVEYRRKNVKTETITVNRTERFYDVEKIQRIR